MSYLDAMRLAWAGCYQVLRPGGALVAIVGNVVRDHKEVDVAGDNARLLEAVGFRPVDVLKHVKAQPSFWRQLHKKKYPDAPVIDCEWVIVMAKA